MSVNTGNCSGTKYKRLNTSLATQIIRNFIQIVSEIEFSDQKHFFFKDNVCVSFSVATPTRNLCPSKTKVCLTNINGDKPSSVSRKQFWAILFSNYFKRGKSPFLFSWKISERYSMNWMLSTKSSHKRQMMQIWVLVSISMPIVKTNSTCIITIEVFMELLWWLKMTRMFC